MNQTPRIAIPTMMAGRYGEAGQNTPTLSSADTVIIMLDSMEKSLGTALERADNIYCKLAPPSPRADGKPEQVDDTIPGRIRRCLTLISILDTRLAVVDNTL